MMSRRERTLILGLAAGMLAIVPANGQQLSLGEAKIEVKRPDQDAAKQLTVGDQAVGQMLEISLDKKLYFAGVPVEPGDYSLLLAEGQGAWTVALNTCKAGSSAEACSQANEVLRTSVKGHNFRGNPSQHAFMEDQGSLSIVVGSESITLPIAAPLSTLWLCGTHDPEHGARSGKERRDLTQRYQCNNWHQ